MRISLARTIALGVFLALFLAGCKFTLPPVNSATLEQYGTARPFQAIELTPIQVRALTDWFSLHGSGWSSSVVSYAPTLFVRAKHTDGGLSVINIMSNMVVVYNRSGQYQQKFTPSELAEIRHIVGTQ
jgi:hypothetical protein